MDVTKVKAELSKIEKVSNQIVKIIQGISLYSRNCEEDPMELIAISSIINDALTIIHDKFKKCGIEIRLKNIPDILILCRPGQLLQVFLNLLNNSYDAVEKSQHKWIEISFAKDSSFLKIFFQDNGLGIPENLVKKIMNPFFTTKSVGKGTGLGLSISQKIIKQHYGQIYYSPQASNTCFIVELPIKD